MSDAQHFCPHCGHPIESDSKFCVHCGYDLTAGASVDNASNTVAQREQTGAFETSSEQGTNDATPGNEQGSQSQTDQSQVESEQPVGEDTLRAARQYSDGYFAWWVKSLKRPSESDPYVHQYYGLTSLAISILLVTFTVTLLISQVLTVIDEFASELDSNFSAGASFSGVEVLILILLIACVYVLIGWAMRRYAFRDSQETIFSYANRLAGLTNVTMILNAVALLLTLLLHSSAMSFKGVAAIFILLGFSSAILNIAFLYSQVQHVSREGMDKVYGLLLAEVGVGIGTFILLAII